jgi:acetyl-CoA carboxylase carboxyltransferase component
VTVVGNGSQFGLGPGVADETASTAARLASLSDEMVSRLVEITGCDSADVSALWVAFMETTIERRATVPIDGVDGDAAASPGMRSPRPGMDMWVQELAERKRVASEGPAGGTERQHARGRLTARERIALLLDRGSFVELNALAEHAASGFGLESRHPPTDGVVTGWGTIDGRITFVFGHDSRIFGGALGETFARKIHEIMDLAEAVGAPIVGLNDGGGARIQEGVPALAGFGGVFRRNVRLSGVTPQISVVLGSCAGGAVYSPALTDFVFMVEGTSNMYITGPDVIAAVTGETVTHDELGGAHTHSARSGVASFVSDDEASCLQDVRYLLSFLPPNNCEAPPYWPSDDDPERRCDRLGDIVPSEPHVAYDVRSVIGEVVDDAELLEVQRNWAQNIVCGLARMDGHVVGIVANQPAVLAGAIDIHASEKAARFVRTCDAFNIPLVTFVDVPGFLPGTTQEYGGIIRHGAKLLYAYCEATVPRVQVVLRKAFGGAYIVMDSKSIGADLSFAWPGNQIAVMGADGAANILFRTEIQQAPDPARRRAELVQLYADKLMDPYGAARRGVVDDVIDPADTRRVLVHSLRMLRAKKEALVARKHGNSPC